MAMGLNPYTPVRDFIKGGQIKDAFLQGIGDPKMRTIIDGIIKGGGRISEPEMYTNEATKAFKTAMGRNEVWGMIRKALPAAAEYSSKHLMQQVVPRVKLGAFSQLLQAELDNFKGPLTDDEFRDMAAKAWDSIDNRFGQLVYDNVFWHPLVKDLSMATVRSLGWSLGTLRELGMGGIDAAQGLGNQALKMSGKEPLKNTNVGVSHRTAYAMALPITMGVYGAMTQYLLTGKIPSRMRDYYVPLTGRKNADGTEERLSLPSYMKDFWGYTQDTAGTLKSKMSPLLSELLNVATNSDYFGNKIRAEDDPWYKQGLSLLKHVGGSVEPFTLSQVAQQVRDTGKFNVLSFAGFNKASAALSKTKAIEMAQHYAYEQVPKGKRTTEQAFRQQQLSQVVGMFRNGEKSDAQSKMRDLKVTPTEAKYIYSHAQGELLPKLIKSLSIDQALRVYEAGTVQEKKSIVRDVEKKLFNATQHNKQNFSIEDFRDFQKRLRAATPH